MAGWRRDVVTCRHFVVPYRKSALNTLQGEAVTLHSFPAAFHVVSQIFRGRPASQLEPSRIGLPLGLFSLLHQPEEFLVIVWLDNAVAQVDALVADEHLWPGNQFLHLMVRSPYPDMRLFLSEGRFISPRQFLEKLTDSAIIKVAP